MGRTVIVEERVEGDLGRLFAAQAVQIGLLVGQVCSFCTVHGLAPWPGGAKLSPTGAVADILCTCIIPTLGYVSEGLCCICCSYTSNEGD